MMPDMDWPVERTIPDFANGAVDCECGKSHYLFFNGGELDSRTCTCGRRYRTEAIGYELVIYAPEEVT